MLLLYYYLDYYQFIETEISLKLAFGLYFLHTINILVTSFLIDNILHV